MFSYTFNKLPLVYNDSRGSKLYRLVFCCRSWSRVKDQSVKWWADDTECNAERHCQYSVQRVQSLWLSSI